MRGCTLARLCWSHRTLVSMEAPSARVPFSGAACTAPGSGSTHLRHCRRYAPTARRGECDDWASLSGTGCARPIAVHQLRGAGRSSALVRSSHKKDTLSMSQPIANPPKSKLELDARLDPRIKKFFAAMPAPQPLLLRVPALAAAFTDSIPATAPQHHILGRQLTKAHWYPETIVERTAALRLAAASRRSSGHSRRGRSGVGPDRARQLSLGEM
jgi:hypothetical protein